jgi:hypothetical protein
MTTTLTIRLPETLARKLKSKARRRFRQGKMDSAVLPDFFIRAQAAVIGCRHLTNDRRRLVHWPDVDFVFPG